MPIYPAALVEFEVVVTQLVRDGVDVNAIGGREGTALVVASTKGHTNIVKVLVDGGADVNAQGGEYGNALQAASYHGHEAIVKLLVDGVNAQGGHYGTVSNLQLGFHTEDHIFFLISRNLLVRRHLQRQHGQSQLLTSPLQA